METPVEEGSEISTEIFISVGPDEEFRAELAPGEYTIGRDPDVEILVDHPTLSRRHAKLLVGDGEVLLIDLESGNGTMIEGAPLNGPGQLYEGQTARLGDVLLRARQRVNLEALPGASRHYRRGALVAQGGMGAVHEARQQVMGRKVAMKVMLREKSASGMRRFLNEARITGMLEHPNIVPVHEVGVDGEGRIFYTMKFVGGTTLAEVLGGLRTGNAEAAQRYPLAVLLTIFQKACDAIAFAHSRGVLHRDIKPDNVMVGEFGEVLVLDWGLAKEQGFGAEGGAGEGGEGGDEVAGGRTMEGSVLGTPAYMPPEQARGEVGALDERSDIYALGAVLHEILYLQAPVSGGGAMETLEKVAAGRIDVMPKCVRPHLPGGKVPPSLEAVRRKAMAFDPARRYPRVQDLQADIAAYQTGFATAAESAGLATHVLLFLKRNRAVSAAVLAGFVLLAVSSAVFSWHQVKARKEAEVAKATAEDKAKEAEESRQRAEESERKARDSKRLAEAQKVEAERSAREAREALARAEQANNEKEEATSARDAAEADKAGSARRFADDANLMISQENLDGAMEKVALAIELAPAVADYRRLHANLLQSSGRFEEAAEEYKKAIELGAGDEAKANLRLSEAWAERRGDALMIPPDVRTELGKELRKQGREDELTFLDAVVGSGSGGGAWSAGGKDEGADALSAFTSQGGWHDRRLSEDPDGHIRLDLSGLEVSSLDNLRKLNVSSLDLRGTKATDLSPLRDMPLKELHVAEGTSDLSPLPVEKLRVLDLTGSQVTDLGHCRSAPLEKLWLDRSRVGSLEPLSGMPLQVLHADAPGVRDFGVIGTLGQLEELSLPAHAAGVPVAGLDKLARVRHPRFQAGEWIDGARFKELAALSDEAWKRWSGPLGGLRLADLGPERVTVVDEPADVPRIPGTFDLDLRGTGVSDLTALRTIPVHRLYLDTVEQPVSLVPLAKHPHLQHLVLAGANVPTLQGVLDNPKLHSIVLSSETTDVRRLHKHPYIKRAGYKADLSARLPTTTVGDLFAERTNTPPALPPPPPNGRAPGPSFVFDDASMDRDVTYGWTLSPGLQDGPGGLVWRPDPLKDGGLGGGCLEFYERGEDLRTTYFFVVPKNLYSKARRNLYGSSLGFELRIFGEATSRSYDGDVVIRSGKRSLHYSFPGRQPARDWRKFIVPMVAGEAWRMDSREGPPATDADMKAVLSDTKEILIRAEYSSGEDYERTGLDNVALWSEEETRMRAQEAAEDEWDSVQELGLDVASGKVDDWARKAGLRLDFHYGKLRRVTEHKGRFAPLLVTPEGAGSPARITLRPEKRFDAGASVRFAARGAATGAGVVVKVLQGGRALSEELVGDAWRELSVPLPAGVAGSGEEACVIEVWPEGDADTYCFVSGLELVSPPPAR